MPSNIYETLRKHAGVYAALGAPIVLTDGATRLFQDYTVRHWREHLPANPNDATADHWDSLYRAWRGSKIAVASAAASEAPAGACTSLNLRGPAGSNATHGRPRDFSEGAQ